IEKLKKDRAALDKVLVKKGEEKAELQRDIRAMQERLRKTEEEIDTQQAERTRIDTVIKDAEEAYKKVLDGSKTLLKFLKTKKPGPSPIK
ncbi:SSNA1 family like protein, partial [Aduncisulcus paluster]